MFELFAQKVSELFNKMRDKRKEILQKQMGQGLQKSLSGSGLETILTYSNQYEVMYVGSIRVCIPVTNTLKI